MLFCPEVWRSLVARTDRAPENRSAARFLGKGGAERACEHCPTGRCERAADRDDAGTKRS